jgi:uncharacterized protein RhaS with RHS repeats
MIDSCGRNTYTYRASRLQIASGDPAGRRITCGYDTAGIRPTTVDAHGGTTAYKYSGLNASGSVANPRNDRRAWTYDALNRVVSVTPTNESAAVYTYSASGSVAWRPPPQ